MIFLDFIPPQAGPIEAESARNPGGARKPCAKARDAMALLRLAISMGLPFTRSRKDEASGQSPGGASSGGVP